MGLTQIANLLGREVVRGDNPRVVCPPGPLRVGGGPLVLVPTIMRSGTHLLIDTILNNFPRYKRSPLYVDLDRLMDDRATRHTDVNRLLVCGGYLVKTHYPQWDVGPERELFVQEVASQAVIVGVDRDREETFRSSAVWGLPVAADRGKYIDSVERFQAFWRPYEHLEVAFSQLTDRSLYPELVARLGRYIGAEPREPLIYPPAPENRLNVYLMKALTRVLGRHAAVINTTIGFRLMP